MCETVVDSLIISVVPVAGIFGEPGTLLVVCVSVDGAKGGGTPVPGAPGFEGTLVDGTFGVAVLVVTEPVGDNSPDFDLPDPLLSPIIVVVVAVVVAVVLTTEPCGIEV